MISKVKKISDLKIGEEVCCYIGDSIIQIVDEICADYVLTHYKSSPNFHLLYPVKQFGKPFYELFHDDYQGVLL